MDRADTGPRVARIPRCSREHLEHIEYVGSVSPELQGFSQVLSSAGVSTWLCSAQGAPDAQDARVWVGEHQGCGTQLD